MKIRMVYLAAGNSRRFGMMEGSAQESGKTAMQWNKLFYEIEGKPMYQHGLEKLEFVLDTLKDSSLVVVSQYPEILKEVEKKQKRWGERIQGIYSPDSKRGISYSIKAGLDSGEAEYYLFCVADQPNIKAKTILSLIEETRKRECRGGYVSWKGKTGNPTIFSKQLVPQLMQLKGDMGGKGILKKESLLCIVEVEEAEELEDIDVKNDVKE